MASLQQAVELHRNGKLAEAEQAYRAVLVAQPRQADALSLLGVVLDAQGRADEAVPLIRKAVALDPKAALFRLHLGNALLATGDTAGAAKEFRTATRLQPTLAEAHYNLGNALRTMEDSQGAIAAYRACLALAPQAHEARNNLALLISAAGDVDGAIAELNSVLAADPNYIQARVNLANIADEAGRYDLAYTEAQKAVALDPTHTDALFALALASTRHGQDANAMALYRQLLALMPHHYQAWDNLAQLLQANANWPEAESAYQQARQLAPSDPDINYHGALFDLLMGRLAKGFAAYDWRFKKDRPQKRLVHAAAPVWDGHNPAGKTILVMDEQGFGDSLMFCRYLPLLQAKGARVIYACRTPLQGLMQSLAGITQFVLMTEAAHTTCDAHCALMDLPHLLGTDSSSIPAAVPYLHTSAGDLPAELMQETALKVGVVWAGNRHHKHDRRRSIPFAQFSALFGVPGVRFYNLLRPDDLRGDEATHFATHGMVDLGSHITDFSVSARFIAALDLVIAVDTATVHLAGALGKPVWVLLPLGPDWRWQIDRRDSPWYPTATLYRQQALDDWSGVLQQMRADLEQKAKTNYG